MLLNARALIGNHVMTIMNSEKPWQMKAILLVDKQVNYLKSLLNYFVHHSVGIQVKCSNYYQNHKHVIIYTEISK